LFDLIDIGFEPDSSRLIRTGKHHVGIPASHCQLEVADNVGTVLRPDKLIQIRPRPTNRGMAGRLSGPGSRVRSSRTCELE
jgi:hypothetical protein